MAFIETFFKNLAHQNAHFILTPFIIPLQITFFKTIIYITKFLFFDIPFIQIYSINIICNANVYIIVYNKN